MLIDAITSNAGWDTIKHKDFLVDVIKEFQNNGIRTSIFVDPDLKQIEGAKATGADRIELYTEAFAHQYGLGNEAAIKPYIESAELANSLGLGINAGHDLSLDNISFFKQNIPGLLEVSIGHALIAESLYLGVENVIQMYLHKLKVMQLHSNILGEGKPFVILHGFLGMSDNWKTLGKHLAEQGFEVHLVDQRNHGRSFLGY